MKGTLFLFVAFLFYKQLSKITSEQLSSISIALPLAFLLAILLVIPNQWFEFKKWKKIVHSFSTITSKTTLVKSYFAGNITGLVTPNLIGNFIGRMYYFERRYRPKIIVLTLLANGIQFLTSIYFGLLSITLFGFKPFQIPPLNPIYLTVFILITLILYFTFEQLLKNFQFLKKINIHLLNSFEIRYSLLLYSLIRYLIFSFQYFLILCSFGVPIDLKLIPIIWSIYFWSTLTPSLWFGKLVIRESISIWILSQYIENTGIILIASISLWCINQGIPAIIGFPFLRMQKK
ncbi:MAG: hypothetical protein ACK48V_04520 [Crocinitomicaceae bacterium]